MKCKNCGNSISNNVQFCPVCGASVESASSQPAARKKQSGFVFSIGLLTGVLVCTVFLCVLMISGVLVNGNQETGPELVDVQPSEEQEDLNAGAQRARLEGEGFSSPEKAVEAYLNAMKRGDVYGMMQTFAIESFAENVHLEDTIARIGVYNVSQVPCLGTDNEYTYSVVVLDRYVVCYDGVWRNSSLGGIAGSVLSVSPLSGGFILQSES